MKALFVFAILLGLIGNVAADCYLHFPPGSDDRNQEENTNRNNANHLFDSQNNAKGGYCRGPALYFYEGSSVHVEWTNQHGCGNNPKVWCNVVLQYMCTGSDADLTTMVRDGTTTDTIEDDPVQAAETDANGEPVFGMHESYAYYQECKKRERNKGLFIADRQVNGRDARFTRQDNNENRYGFECQEESEYYPYWAPTPWKDIAVFVEDLKFCNFYKKNSENNNGRGYCRDDNNDGQTTWNKDMCGKGDYAGDTWVETPSHKMSPPDCLKMALNRDNHLGNTITGLPNVYNWKVPSHSDEDCMNNDKITCNCVLRIRYNISTGDTGDNGNNPDSGFIDYKSNGAASPIHNDETDQQDGFSYTLAMDTTQFGRTFQDRTHVFHLRKRPGSLLGKIYNLNVRGKRGNIVQAYPAVEYDFVPNDLSVFTGDHIHFQWTGCDKNPAGNAGEGTDQTDRHNIVQTECENCNHPATQDWIDNKHNKKLFPNADMRKRAAYLDQDKANPPVCLTADQLDTKNGGNENNIEQDTQNCMKLNAASQYFDLGPVRMNLTDSQSATFYYISTRNNNFSNRSQKGVITVSTTLGVWAIVLVVIGSAIFIAAAVIGGMTFYAKSHPHSSVARFVQRLG